MSSSSKASFLKHRHVQQNNFLEEGKQSLSANERSKGEEEEGKERGREGGMGNWKWSFGRNVKNRKRLSLPLPLPSSFRLRFKISLFAFIPLITILSGRARCTMATVTGSPSEAGLVCGHWIMPMLWSGGRADKISNKLAGDVACLGGSMVEHQPRLLGSRVHFPAGAFAIFSVSAKASLPISLSPFPSSFFPFLFLSLPLPLPSTFRLRFKISLFACIPLQTILLTYWITTNLLFSNIDVAKNAHRQHRTKKLTYQRQIAFSICWTRQEPCCLVGSSVILDRAVPYSNSTTVNSLFLCHFFFSKWGQRKISKSFKCSVMASAHARQWREITSM